MGMRRDAGTWGALIENASPTTPTVPLESPTNALPPAAAPQPPATDVPRSSATPSEPAIAIAMPSKAPGRERITAPWAERPVREEERLPANADPNAAGGLFAITRPLGAQVFVDNKLIGNTPLFMSQLSSGSHEVRLELPGFRNVLVVNPSRTKQAFPSGGETRRDSLSSRHVFDTHVTCARCRIDMWQTHVTERGSGGDHCRSAPPKAVKTNVMGGCSPVCDAPGRPPPHRWPAATVSRVRERSAVHCR